tara:strand:- start:1730 stop:1870 length:141 start_codon:yes stop_codon:yes gene_type:complete
MVCKQLIWIGLTHPFIPSEEGKLVVSERNKVIESSSPGRGNKGEGI